SMPALRWPCWPPTCVRSGPMRKPILVVLAVGVAGAVGFAGLDHLQARHKVEARAAAQTGGDSARGAAAIAARGCGACRQIPGVAGAQGKVGPPLSGFAGRGYIAGRAPNTPDNLVGWIIDPH